MKGVGASTVRRWRRTYQIPSRPTGKRVDPKKLCPDERLTQLVAENYSIAGICRALGWVVAGSRHATLKQRISDLGLDTSHFGTVKFSFLGYGGHTIPSEELFTLSSHIRNSRVLKRRLLQEGYPEQCALCGQHPEWFGRKLVLQLDHIDGNRRNDVKSNLRLLCPNCHSQTDTFTGKNTRKVPCVNPPHMGTPVPAKIREPKVPQPPKAYLCACGNPMGRRSRTCAACVFRATKIEWPSIEELAERVKTTPMLTLSKELGVSDRALAKRLKKHGVATPEVGYWRKLECGKLPAVAG